MAKKKKSSNESGIRELVWVDPKTIDDNPMNWREHPTRQKQAIGASIKANGWAGTLIFNETTGRLVDGHARKDVAIKAGVKSVPVLLGNWTEEQEKHLLATLDPLTAMAETDADALQKLTESLEEDEEHLKDVEENERKILSRLTKELDAYAYDVRIGDQKKSMLPKQVVVKEDPEDPVEPRDDSIYDTEYDENAIFLSTNPWGIPDLLPDMFCDVLPTEVWDRDPDFNVKDPGAVYCHSARSFPSDREGGILMFYTEDWRFESVWNDTVGQMEKFIDEDWTALGPPAYSYWWDWPFAVQIHNIYRCRWLQRFWQEAGIPVIPHLYWDNTDASFEWGIATLPTNIPIVSVESRTIQRHGAYWKRFNEGIEATISLISPENILIYGGGEADNKSYMRKLPGGTNYILMNSYMGARRKQMEKNKKSKK